LGEAFLSRFSPGVHPCSAAFRSPQATRFSLIIGTCRSEKCKFLYDELLEYSHLAVFHLYHKSVFYLYYKLAKNPSMRLFFIIRSITCLFDCFFFFSVGRARGESGLTLRSGIVLPLRYKKRKTAGRGRNPHCTRQNFSTKLARCDITL
jgi:hypothetical protein